MINGNSGCEIEKLIKETQNDNPAQTTLDIYQYIKIHQNLVVKKFNGYIKYFEDYFDILNSAISSLNYLPKENWPQYKSLQYLMFPEALKTLHRSFEDIISGYYDEATILLRCVYETYIKMVFIVCYPEDYEAIFRDRKGKRNFKLKNFLKDDLHLDWEFIYSFMSYVSHSKIHLILERLIKLSKKEDKDPIRLEYKYDENALSRPMNESTFLLYALFHTMLTTFKDDFDDSKIDRNKIMRMVKTDKVLRSMIESFPNKFSSIVRDIDKIDMIFDYVKRGRDWKVGLKNRGLF